MNTKKTQNAKRKTQNGYTLLFAVLTATLVLGVAVFILGVSRKQLILSGAARDSMYSIYAADSGIECAAAAYEAGTLATFTSGGQAQNASIQCFGETYNATSWAIDNSVTGWGSSPDLPVKSGPMNIGFDDGTCADVTVWNGYDTNGKSMVSIESRGYNYCTTSFGPQPSSRTVERALRLTYQ